MQEVKKSKYYPYIIWGIALLVYIIVFFHRVATGVVREEILTDFGLLDSKQGGTLFTLLGTMYMYAYMLMQVPTGILADTLGPRKTITLGALFAAVGSLIFGCSSTMVWAFVGRFLVGIGVSVVFVCILKLIVQWFPKEKFATLSGATSFIGNMGALLAMTPLALLTRQVGWRSVFVIIGILTGVLGLLCFIMIRENQPVPQVLNKEISGDSLHIGKSLQHIIGNKKLYGIMGAYALTFGTTMAVTGNWGVTMMQDIYHVDKAVGANAMSIITLGVACGCATIGRLSDKMKSRKKPMVVFAGINMLCWILFASRVLPLKILWILLFILGFTATSFVVSWAYAKEQYRPEYSGMTMSVVNFAGFLGGAIIPQVVGAIYDYMPHTAMENVWGVVLWVLAGCISLAFVLILMMKED